MSDIPVDRVVPIHSSRLRPEQHEARRAADEAPTSTGTTLQEVRLKPVSTVCTVSGGPLFFYAWFEGGRRGRSEVGGRKASQGQTQRRKDGKNKALEESQPVKSLPLTGRLSR